MGDKIRRLGPRLNIPRPRYINANIIIAIITITLIIDGGSLGAAAVASTGRCWALGCDEQGNRGAARQA